MIGFAWTLAIRELRGGLAGFRVFLLCLTVGVAGIAAVGSVTEAIERGLAGEGSTILGGDIALRFAYRLATSDERAWLDSHGSVVEMVTMRSMLSAGGARALAEVKAVRGAYPLFGNFDLEGGGALSDALDERNGLFGLIADRILVDRFGLVSGDTVALGGALFRFSGTIVTEPDRASAGFSMGPRIITSVDALSTAGLLSPGVVYRGEYRVRLSSDKGLDSLEEDFRSTFPEAGARWRDRREAAPGIGRFVRRIGAFLTIVGLAALAIGGVGVQSAVRGYLQGKISTIATLRTMGASANTVFAAYLIQIGVLAGFGILCGLVIGAGMVALIGPLVAMDLPVPAEFTVYPARLLEAALYGALAALLSTLWPLWWLRDVRPAQLYRGDAGARGYVPKAKFWSIFVLLALGSLAAVYNFSDAPGLTVWSIGGLAAAFVSLRVMGWLASRLARWLSHGSLGRLHPSVRLALGSVGAPGSGTPAVIMALGLGLGVLSTIGQVDANLQKLIRDQLPTDSPAFFFVDIQHSQLDAFKKLLLNLDGVDRLNTAPMLRGVLTHLAGVPATSVKIDPGGAWVLRGDRGVSYSASPPENVVIVEGDWWSPTYSGPPLVSFAKEEGEELGLSLGDTITINILGRPIEATIANFRRVEWRGLGINFLMILSPGALAGAPHTHIATLHAAEAAEAPILRTLGDEMPNITAILVRDQIARVSDGLTKIGSGIRWGALAVLLTGLAVIVGTAAADEKRRTAEASMLKVLGATRLAILASFALRAAITGGLAGMVALVWSTISAWAVTRYALDAQFHVQIGQVILIILFGIGLSLAASFFFALGPLGRKPANVLRAFAG